MGIEEAAASQFLAGRTKRKRQWSFLRSRVLALRGFGELILKLPSPGLGEIEEHPGLNTSL